MSQTESATDDAAITKQLPDLLRSRAGGDIKILGRFSDHKIAYGSTHQVGLVSIVMKSVKGLQRIAIDVLARDIVFISSVGSKGDRLQIGGLGFGNEIIVDRTPSAIALCRSGSSRSAEKTCQKTPPRVLMIFGGAGVFSTFGQIASSSELRVTTSRGLERDDSRHRSGGDLQILP